jgi:hypothetical protein
MGVATVVTRYLANRGIASDIVLNPHTKRASASAEASHVPANRVAKAIKSAEVLRARSVIRPTAAPRVAPHNNHRVTRLKSAPRSGLPPLRAGALS